MEQTTLMLYLTSFGAPKSVQSIISFPPCCSGDRLLVSKVFKLKECVSAIKG